MEKRGFVYMMTNLKRNVLYAGVTNDLVKRVWQHKNKQGSKFTRRYNVTDLVYYEVYDGIELAIEREKQIKNLVRRKKDQLVAEFNPEWKDLWNDII